MSHGCPELHIISAEAESLFIVKNVELKYMNSFKQEISKKLKIKRKFYSGRNRELEHVSVC